LRENGVGLVEKKGSSYTQGKEEGRGVATKKERVGLIGDVKGRGSSAFKRWSLKRDRKKVVKAENGQGGGTLGSATKGNPGGDERKS